MGRRRLSYPTKRNDPGGLRRLKNNGEVDGSNLELTNSGVLQLRVPDILNLGACFDQLIVLRKFDSYRAAKAILEYELCFGSAEKIVMDFAARRHADIDFPTYPSQSDVSMDVLVKGTYIWDVIMAYKFKSIQNSPATPKPELKIFCFNADFTRPLPDPLDYNLEHPFVINFAKIFEWMYSNGDLFRNISSFINCYLSNSTEDENEIKNYTYCTSSKKVDGKLIKLPENVFFHMKACIITLFSLDSEAMQSDDFEEVRRSMLYRDFIADNNWCRNTSEMDSLFNDMKAKVNEYLNRGIEFDVSRILKQIRRKISNSKGDGEETSELKLDVNMD